MFVFSGIHVGCESAASREKKKWPHWKATAAAASQLDKETEVLGIRICPPKGFRALPETSVDLPGGSKAKITGWASTREAKFLTDESSTRAIQLLVAPVSADMSVTTAMEASKMLIGSVKDGVRNFNEEDRSHGYINGHEFYRVTWTAPSPDTGELNRGHFYVAVIDDTIYQFSTQDSGNEEEDLEVCHASILSFQK